MISIIVPAHNEAEVIARSVNAMTEGSEPGELEIIIVCNGCTDDTAGVARQLGGCVSVIETTVPSKVNALNLGDRTAQGFPRFYVDADVIFPIASIRAIARILRDGNLKPSPCTQGEGERASLPVAAAPSIRLDLANCNWAVKAFYDIDRRMPSHREGFGGSGVYALSEAGRKKFAEFPNITADDAFIRLSYTRDERVTVKDVFSTVTPPRDLAGLVKIKTRSHFGNAQLRAMYPAMFANRGPGNRKALLSLLARPALWLKLAIYLYVKSAARITSRRKLKRGNDNQWERDDTSRKPASDPVHA